MTTFSQRQGLRPVTVDIQLTEISNEARNGLWNALTTHFWDQANSSWVSSFRDQSPDLYWLIRRIWQSHFKKTIDSIPAGWGECRQKIKSHFFECSWNEVYDFLEFVAKNFESKWQGTTENKRSGLVSACNAILERENCGYRFVNFEIAAITSPTEISEVEQASKSQFGAVNTHISSALSLMVNKKEPDYRNSIKESISAVEAVCIALVGKKTSGLKEAIGILESQKIIRFHGAEKAGILALYGYTSDSDGIRHAIFEEPTLDFDDAKFMLVSCSAFCNLLISKAKG